MPIRRKKGGAAGDPWPGDRIAGPVITMPSGSFESDKGIPANMQYSATPASLAAVNVFEGGGSKNPRVERERIRTTANARLAAKKFRDTVDALLKLKIDYQPAKPKKVKFSKTEEFKSATGYEITKYKKGPIDLNKTPSSGGRKKKTKK